MFINLSKYRLAGLIASVLFIQPSLAADQIRLQSYYDLADHSGQTYLNFMRTEVKPAMDHLATEGYTMRGEDSVEEAYRQVDKKIQRRVNGRWGGLKNVKRIAGLLEGKTVTLNTLADEIAKVDRTAPDRFNMATFLGLASGGGVTIKYYDDNYGHNVHYDVKEERSGRSFGVGPTRKANDASDKNYLNDLENYVRGQETRSNTTEFYKTLFEALLASNPVNYPAVDKEGQTVLTDFLSVFTAEQARNLMDGRVHPHWDAALLEVTLLASFHAGQEEIALYYQNIKTKKTSFTETTLRQTPCEYPSVEQAAHLQDYWQFSRNITSEKNCRRSGINVTKSQFRRLGKDITSYISRHHSATYKAVVKSMGLKRSSNLYQSLSYFLIDDKLPKALSDERVEEITLAWVSFLQKVQDEAKAITQELGN